MEIYNIKLYAIEEGLLNFLTILNGTTYIYIYIDNQTEFQSPQNNKYNQKLGTKLLTMQIFYETKRLRLR
jgi:hypothetical protein